jgi:hypothetical protein
LTLSNGRTRIIVAARSNFYDRNLGGVWISDDMGVTFRRTLEKPVFDLADAGGGEVWAAVVMTAQALVRSVDGGLTWTDASAGVTEHFTTRLPFYSQLAVSNPNIGATMIYMATYAVNPANNTDIDSYVFQRPLNALQEPWQLIPGQRLVPSLDQDHMPKDRVAIIADPNIAGIIYIAGNAASGPAPCDGDSCVLVFRVDTAKAEWTFMSGHDDTVDNSQPHPDCRGFAFDSMTGDLLLVNDGGLHIRSQPQAPGGRWRSGAGDIGIMEFCR